MKLSVVVPCYYEEKNINVFYYSLTTVLSQEGLAYELIFVNDGSTDHTLEMIKDLAKKDPCVLYISFSRNFGKESAMLAGLTYSSGDAVVIMDADMQHPPEMVPQLFKEYLKGYDQVIARRNRKGDGIGRSLLSCLYYKIMNRFIDVELADGIGDFRLLSRRAVNAVIGLKEYNRFSKGLFSWIGFKEKIINYENKIRLNGSSKWTLSKLLNYGIDGVISFNNRPLRISIYIGTSITFIALLYVLLSFIKSLVYGIDVPGYFTLIASILLIGGIQLMFLGVIGEYIGRIYYESKQRPHFIVEENNLNKK